VTVEIVIAFGILTAFKVRELAGTLFDMDIKPWYAQKGAFLYILISIIVINGLVIGMYAYYFLPMLGYSASTTFSTVFLLTGVELVTIRILDRPRRPHRHLPASIPPSIQSATAMNHRGNNPSFTDPSFSNLNKEIAMSQQTVQKPEIEFRAGTISVAVWRNDSDRDGVSQIRYSFRFNKRYKDKQGEWQDSDCYFPEDLPKLQLVLAKAYEYVTLKEKSNTEGSVTAVA